MRSLVVYQPAMADSPPVPPADVPSQSSSGSPGLGCAQVRATDSLMGGAYPPAPPATYLDAPQQVPDRAEVAQMVHVAAGCCSEASPGLPAKTMSSSASTSHMSSLRRPCLMSCIASGGCQTWRRRKLLRKFNWGKKNVQEEMLPSNG